MEAVPEIDGSREAARLHLSAKPSISWEEIQVVQNLIEKGLSKYMTKAQIMVSLERHADITPNYVTMVWEKLEEQNPVFFWSYGLHLQLKEQILAFNYLAQEQVHLLTRVGRDLDAFGKASTAGGASAGEASATAGDAHVARGSSRGGAADAEGEEISSILGEAAAAGDLGVVSHAHGSGIATEYDTDIFFGAPSPVPSPTVPKT